MVLLIVLLLKVANDDFYREACKRKPINNDITVIKLIKRNNKTVEECFRWLYVFAF